MDLTEILGTALKARASDIHLKPGLPPVYRIDGALRPHPKLPRLSTDQTIAFANEIMNEVQKLRFQEVHEIDLSYGVPGLGRFRVNVFTQRGSVSMVLRFIPFDIKSMEELQLPPIIKNRRGAAWSGFGYRCDRFWEIDHPRLDH